MGQQGSKSHAPLTFGYINHNNNSQEQQQQGERAEEKPQVITFEEYLNNKHLGRERVSTPDFVLNNPHLYKLEFTCQHCSSPQQPHTRKSSSSEEEEEEVIVAEQVNTPCKQCKQNKRLSLVRRDLASDLNYIDETYYPNIVHYYEDLNTTPDVVGNSGEEISGVANDELEEEQNTLQDGENWSKLTFGQITPNLPKRLASSSQLAVDLSGKSLIKLSSSIGYLHNLTKLDLSDNQMITLPKAIGQLVNLRIFNASKNQLESIPESINNLTKLKAINLSHNRLVTLPKTMGALPNLIILIINHNQLMELPRELANLQDLITLNISNNPLKTIPAEIATLKSLRKLTAEDCAFNEEFVHQLVHDPPSLFEICARKMVASGTTALPPALNGSHMAEYFKREQTCSFCYGPYFDSFVTRGRFIERTGRQVIALEYKMCCAHWNTEQERLQAMFSTSYHTHASSFSQQQQQHAIDDEILDTSMDETMFNTPSSPMATAATSLHEEQQQDYFSSMRRIHHNHGSAASRKNNSHSRNEILFIPTFSREEIMSLSPTTESFLSSSAGSSSSSSPYITTSSLPSSSQPNHQKPAFNSTTPPPPSSSSHTINRPRSSSTSSSSLLRISAMQQNLSAALRQQQQQECTTGFEREHVVLPFATLNGRQSEEADRILQQQSRSTGLVTDNNTSLSSFDEIQEEERPPIQQQQQQQQGTTSGSGRSRSIKKSNKAIKEGFASLGAKLGRHRNRDRSETF